MKYVALLFALAVCIGPVHAAKPCEELKAEIAAKIEGKGVKNYALEIVEKDKQSDQRVVGTCEAGTKKITYTRK